MQKTLNQFRILIIAIMVSLPGLVKAKVPGGDDTQDVPLDGGLVLLIAVGVAYGLFVAYKKRKLNLYLRKA